MNPYETPQAIEVKATSIWESRWLSTFLTIYLIVSNVSICIFQGKSNRIAIVLLFSTNFILMIWWQQSRLRKFTKKCNENKID